MTPPRIIAVGEEPPPMEPPPPNGRRGGPSDRDSGKGKPSGAKTKSGERFGLLNAFVDFAVADLSRAEIAVWLVLFRDTRDGTARTSYDDLARRAGCDRRNVGRAVRRLERVGLLKIVHRGGLRQGPSSYRVRGLAKDG